VRSRELPTGPVPINTGIVELRRSPDVPDGVMVLVNGTESSYLDLADPRRLEFEYMQQMVAVLDHVAPPPAPVRAVHLGAAGCALARAMDAARPGSRQIAVEIDAALAEHARAWFDLPRSPRLRIRVADARVAVEGVRPASQDVVVRDAFRDHDVPAHLRTVEFTAAVSRALAPGGIYLANCADAPPLILARREAATVAQVFAHTAVITEPAILRGRRHGNVVLVGSPTPLPLARLARTLLALPLPVTLVAGDDVERFRGSARPFHDSSPTPGNGEGPAP
jgi:spermidine synthase